MHRLAADIQHTFTKEDLQFVTFLFLHEPIATLLSFGGLKNLIFFIALAYVWIFIKSSELVYPKRIYILLTFWYCLLTTVAMATLLMFWGISTSWESKRINVFLPWIQHSFTLSFWLLSPNHCCHSDTTHFMAIKTFYTV